MRRFYIYVYQPIQLVVREQSAVLVGHGMSSMATD